MKCDLSIDQVVDLLGLEKDPKTKANATTYNVRCPFCGDTKYHMNINRAKNTFNCVTCGEKSGGGILHLYARAALGYELVPGVNTKKTYAKLMDALGNNRNYTPTYNTDPVMTVSRAKDAVLNETYSGLLRFLYFKLSDEHRENLLKRGLSEQAIKKNGYRSIGYDLSWTSNYPKAWEIYKKNKLDNERKKYDRLQKKSQKAMVAGMIIASALKHIGCELQGVPGFFKLNGVWFFNLDYGMVIPTRNIKGEIVGLQVRTNNKNLRYLTISSKDLPEGVTEGISRIHFPLSNQPLSKDTKVYFTEGPLKSDVALDLMGNKVFFIAIQGVNNRHDLPFVFKYLKEQGIDIVNNALDMDKVTNPHVAAASRTIGQLAEEQGITVSIEAWDPTYCKEKFIELAKLAKENNIDISSITKENVFVATGQLANLLWQKNIRHSIKMVNGKEVKNYWQDATKGIDDVLLLYLKTKKKD